MMSCIFGGAAGSKLIRVGAATHYRSNILVAGSQLGAGMDAPFAFPTNGSAFARIAFTGNDVGGGVTVSYPPLGNSLIDDQLADQRRAGKTFETNSTSRQLIPLFSVAIDGQNPHTGTNCVVTVSGLVGGVGGGIARQELLVARNGGDAVIALAGPVVKTVVTTGFFNIDFNVSGGTATFTSSHTPTSGTTRFDAQIRCSGGRSSLRRLRAISS